MDEEKAIELFAKKLAENASLEELNELENLLRNDDELGFVLTLVTDAQNSENVTGNGKVEAAFERLISQMKKNNLINDANYKRFHSED